MKTVSIIDLFLICVSSDDLCFVFDILILAFEIKYNTNMPNTIVNPFKEIWNISETFWCIYIFELLSIIVSRIHTKTLPNFRIERQDYLLVSGNLLGYGHLNHQHKHIAVEHEVKLPQVDISKTKFLPWILNCFQFNQNLTGK